LLVLLLAAPSSAMAADNDFLLGYTAMWEAAHGRNATAWSLRGRVDDIPQRVFFGQSVGNLVRSNTRAAANIDPASALVIEWHMATREISGADEQDLYLFLINWEVVNLRFDSARDLLPEIQSVRRRDACERHIDRVLALNSRQIRGYHSRIQQAKRDHDVLARRNATAEWLAFKRKLVTDFLSLH
jgi:hypothetical protein